MSNPVKIMHCIWFDDNAEEAAAFYAGVFDNASVGQTEKYSEEAAAASGKHVGDTMVALFTLENLEFLGLNGGPQFKPNPAISFFIHCDTEAEVERYFNALAKEGKTLMPLDKYDFSEKYGWCEDRFGVSWQVMLTNADVVKRSKLMPCLLFTGDVSGKTREAVDLYTSIFDQSKTGQMVPYTQPGLGDKTMYADFMIAGQWMAAMDSPQDHAFDFTEGNSIMILCDTQQQIDHFWDRLTEDGGTESVCGWLKDKFGVSWQVAPANMAKINRSPAAMSAMMKMKKLDLAVLTAAAEE